jgi:hypothetical protein
MELKKFIKTNIREYLNENYNLIDFNNFPKNVLKTLEDEYGHYYMYNFDWNTKQDEFKNDGDGFQKWLENNKREEFIKNLNKLITKTREDLILKIKQKNIKTVLNNFEELIIPTLGNEILIGPISKYFEIALLNIGMINTDINHINKELSKAYLDAKNIIDDDGSLNYSKIEPSTLFSGNEISFTKFENFIKNNPEYKGIFEDWKRLFNMEMDLSMKDLNAYRDSTKYSDIKDLYNFLVDFRKKQK